MDELLRAGFIKIGNAKININDLSEEAWSYLVGGPNTPPDLRKYFKSVAWLNRGVHLRKQGVESMPFSIKRGDTIVDSSNDYQNVLGWLPDPRRLLGVIEQSLTMNGRSYLFKERLALGGRGLQTGLRHMKASSISPIYNTNSDNSEYVYGELMGFDRDIGNGVKRLDVDDVVYFWPSDDNVEQGPPEDWPALAALQAAGVLYAVDGFATSFFERGAIKVTLLVTKGNVVEAERDRLKTWWSRLLGNAWAAEVVNADAVEPVPVGEGLDSLADTELTGEKREDIATALGIPYEMLFKNVNRASSEQGKLNWYEDTIIPECNAIAGTLNEQVFNPLGYSWEFEPQSLSIFQEDEEHRSSAFSMYVGAGIRPSIVGEFLGIELPDNYDYPDLDEKFDQGFEMAEQLTDVGMPGEESDEVEDEDDEDEDDDKTLQDIDLEKWRRKVANRMRDGKEPACAFESDHIPLVMLGAIEGALEAVKTIDEVQAVFENVWVAYP